MPIWRPGVEKDATLSSQYVFLSEDFREIIIRLPGDSSGKVIRAKIDNNVQPAVKSAVSLRSGGQYLYTYEIRNGSGADRSITIWAIVAPDGIESPPIRFGKWRGPALSPGMPSTKQTLLPGIDVGRGLTWVYDSERGEPVAPGGSADDFVIESSYRPGYTTAYLRTWDAVKWPPMDPNLEWPDVLATQTRPVLTMEWLAKQVLTVGPMFSPDEKPDAIARNLLLGIRQLTLMGEFNGESAFLKEIRDALTGTAAHGSLANASLRNAPSSVRERELAQVVQLSLRIQTPR